MTLLKGGYAQQSVLPLTQNPTLSTQKSSLLKPFVSEGDLNLMVRWLGKSYAEDRRHGYMHPEYRPAYKILTFIQLILMFKNDLWPSDKNLRREVAIRLRMALPLNRSGTAFAWGPKVLQKHVADLIPRDDKLRKILIENATELEEDVYIFDRLHITHAFRTKAEVEKFAEIETELLKHDPILIFLKIDEEKIPGRISWAIKNRSSDWRHHAQTHGNDEQVSEYYTKQQRELEVIIDKSMLPHRTVDTSRMNFEETAKEVYRSYCL